MIDAELKDGLKKLRAEVNDVTSENAEAKDKLNTLINDIEKKLAEPDNTTHHNNLIQDIKDTISQFESEHPRATAILNDIMVSLSNMGI
ncbi:MAG: DUF4404 family protein [Proteobacteria bacterium]|nr:DUF4404 family protein [Pseudomonadota bacterium]